MQLNTRTGKLKLTVQERRRLDEAKDIAATIERLSISGSRLGDYGHNAALDLDKLTEELDKPASE